MVCPAGQQVNASSSAGQPKLGIRHKVLTGCDDFPLSYSPLDRRVLLSRGGVLSPLAVCSVRLQSTAVACIQFLPQFTVGSALIMATQASAHTHTK